MILRSVPPSYMASHPHPSWERFSARLRGTETVLVIHAPHGTGRLWFARSWSQQQDVPVVFVTDGTIPPPHTGFTTASTLAQALAVLSPDPATPTAPPSRVAVIIDSLDLDWGSLALVDWAQAEVSDLLLTPDEIASLTPSGDAAALPAQQVHQQTGGWLDPAYALAQDGAASTPALTALMPSLAHWIERIDEGWNMAKAAYLEPITDHTLEVFFDEVHGRAPSLSTFEEVGLLVDDGDGGLIMPDLIRSGMKELVHRNDAALSAELAPKAIEAVADAEGALPAISRAWASRQWGVLARLLDERWADLFTSDARTLRKALEMIPRRMLNHLLGDFGTAALYILAGAGPQGMNFILPDGSVEYAHDAAAQRMRTRMTALYREPGIQALSYGLVEVGYLRIMGHDLHAADAARRLLAATRRVETTRRISPQLASILHLHAGVALQFAGDLAGAYTASLEGYRRVDGTDRMFLLADCSSKLAVISALRGDTEEARHWIEMHAQSIDRVGWGRATVGRSAVLARALVALTELDLPRADDILRTLPAEPDQDETWQIHAYTLALRDLAHGEPEKALSLVHRVRYEYAHPATMPLARQLLGLIEHAAATDGALLPLDGEAEDDAMTGFAPLAVLRSHRALLMGDADRAASLLTRARVETTGARWRNLALQLQAILGRHDREDIIDHLVTEVAQGRGELPDLVLLRLHGALAEEHLQRLDPVPQDRLRRIPAHFVAERRRPVLTPREADVLDALRQGLTRAEIAQQQMRSENTVRSQVRSLYRKLESGSLEEALATARQYGL